MIKRFLEGDREAFDELVIRHQKQMYLTAYRMVGDAETAEEIAQEAFIRAFKGLRSFRHKAHFSTWLYRIIMNLCYTELKRRKKESAMKTEAVRNTSSPLHEKMAHAERMSWLERQINLLPFKQKSALTLRIFQGLSFKEIGHSMGCSAGSARVNYRHAFLKLKDALIRSGEEL